MFPFNFEWTWDIAHLVFHGAFWYVLAIVGLGLTYCVIKSVVDTVGEEENSHHH